MVKFRGEREIIFPERGGDAKFFKGMRGEREIFFQLSEEKKRGRKRKKILAGSVNVPLMNFVLLVLFLVLIFK